MALAMASAGL